MDVVNSGNATSGILTLEITNTSGVNQSTELAFLPPIFPPNCSVAVDSPGVVYSVEFGFDQNGSFAQQWYPITALTAQNSPKHASLQFPFLKLRLTMAPGTVQVKIMSPGLIRELATYSIP